MKKVVKPVLAEALLKITNDNHIVIIPVTDVHHIIVGGALLHHDPRAPHMKPYAAFILNAFKLDITLVQQLGLMAIMRDL